LSLDEPPVNVLFDLDGTLTDPELGIGNSDPQDRCVYSDIDMVAGPGSERYRHRDGTPYPPKPG